MITREQVVEWPGHRFIAFASDLGMGPGQWPKTLATNLGNGQVFARCGAQCDADGDIQWVEYRQELGCITLKVFND